MGLRFELVDYLHLVYKCIAMPPLSCVMYVDGERKVVDTVIPSLTCKNVWKFSSNGKHPTGVFMEGGAPIRKVYFNAVEECKTYIKMLGEGKTLADIEAAMQTTHADDKAGYKAGRTGLNNQQKVGVQLATDRMVKGGLSVYQVPGFEADDLLYVMWKQIRTQFPDARIDVFTGDMDLLPLVDDMTHVYMRGNRTWAEPMCGQGVCNFQKEGCTDYEDDTCKCRREYKNYYEVTPENWDEFISYRSAFKGFEIPYNSVYLFKMLRGDTSDNVPMAEKGWGAKKWNALIGQMHTDGVDFASTFRYDVPWETMSAILSKYFKPDVLELMRLNAEGIRPRACIADLINLMPYPNSVNFDFNDCYTKLTTNQQYTPNTIGERLKAMAVYDCIKMNINPSVTIQLRTPVAPDLGHFQQSLNELKINLSKANMSY